MEKRPKHGYGFIYKYTSPSGFSYIGQTTRSLKERAGHEGKGYRGCSRFYEAIKKYKIENFDVDILAEVKKEDLDEMEKKYIQIFNTLSPNGYNLTYGGQIKPSKVSRHVYQYSSETGELLKEWLSCREVAVAFNTIPQTFQPCLEGTRFTQYGYCWSYLKLKKFPIHERIVDPHSKTVKMYSVQGDFIKEFPSIAMAAREIGGERSAIRKCCRHEIKTHKGYRWECSEILLQKKYNNTPKPVRQICPTTGEIIQVFPSISAAARSLNKETSLIRNVLDNKNKTAYGYKWETA